MLRQLPLWRNFSALTTLLGLLDTSVRCTQEQGRRLVLQDGSEAVGGTNTIETFCFQVSLMPQKRARNALISSGHCPCLHTELSISSYGAISVSSSGSRTWLEQNQNVRQKYSDKILNCLKSPSGSCGTVREPRSRPGMQQSHTGLRVTLDVHSNTSSLYLYVTQTVSGDL